MSAAYAYTDAHTTRSEDPEEVGQRPVGIPYHQASLWGDYRFRNWGLPMLHVGLGARYVGHSPSPHAGGTPSYVVMDMLPPSSGRWRLALTVDNLADKTYATIDPAGYTTMASRAPAAHVESPLVVVPTCSRCMRVYRPPSATSSSCRPRSTMRPWSRTRMQSASRMVESRWAMMNVVRPRWRLRSPSKTRCSDSESRPELGSSMMRMRESRRMARAIPMRWRCRGAEVALSHHRVVALGGASLNACACASRAASMISRVASGAVCDVLPHGCEEQLRLLQHERDLAAERANGDLADILAVDDTYPCTGS